MADATTKKLVELLQSGESSDVRSAAALVLGEVGGKEGHVTQTLVNSLDDEDPLVRARALSAIGKLKIDFALPRLLERVEKGGEEAELAAQAAARLGARGTRALQDLMHKVAPGLRRRIASALAAGGTASSETAAVSALLDKDPGVVEAATRSLMGQIPGFSSSHRKTLADHLLELLRDKDASLSGYSETAVVRFLAALNDPRAERVLWERTRTPHAPEMRAAALQALGKWITAPTKDQCTHLLACVTDSDFRVVAPALMILRSAAVSDRSLREWLPLFDAPDIAVRLFAIEKMGDKDRPDIATALLAQLDHPDRNVRDQALAKLGALKHGRTALVAALLQADNPDRAWTLARAQGPLVKEYPSALREKVFALACEYLEGGDRRSDAQLFLLRAADTEKLHGRLKVKALALRKKKNYEKALLYFRYLTKDPACAVSIRLESMACALKLSAHDLNAEARAADPALQQCARVLANYEAEVSKFISKAKWLEAEDLFYLGFHFAEQTSVPQKFGGQVLHLLLKRSPKSKLAKDARAKLRREGLD